MLVHQAGSTYTVISYFVISSKVLHFFYFVTRSPHKRPEEIRIIEANICMPTKPATCAPGNIYDSSLKIEPFSLGLNYKNNTNIYIFKQITIALGCFIRF